MDLSKIISITGKSGLYRVVAQGRQALIAESLEDGKRVPVHASVRVSSLDEISMFTKGDDVPLSKVLEQLHKVEKGGPSADPKGDVDALYAKLGEALPDHDRERIYPSDVRKLFSWYALLLKAGAFTAKEEKKEAAEEASGKAADKKKAEGTKKSAKSTSAATKKAAAAPKAATGGKAKSTPVRKGSQRGS
ncbi:MAG: DUF5606 domain-containing protein [Flavobacteriales bacterium]